MDLFVGPDELDKIARLLDPVSLACFAQTCTTFRGIAKTITGGADLSSLQPTHLHGELANVLGISRHELRKLYDGLLAIGARIHIDICFHRPDHADVFHMNEVVPVLLESLSEKTGRSGWEVLDERLKMVRTKRERLENLNARRHANMVKRRALLDAWLAEERPFVADTVGAWLASLKERTPRSNVGWGDAVGDRCVKVRRFLTAEMLTVPKFIEVKSAMLEIESHAERHALRRTDLEELRLIRNWSNWHAHPILPGFANGIAFSDT